jgi:hypothetical protein
LRISLPVPEFALTGYEFRRLCETSLPVPEFACPVPEFACLSPNLPALSPNLPGPNLPGPLESSVAKRVNNGKIANLPYPGLE